MNKMEKFLSVGTVIVNTRRDHVFLYQRPSNVDFPGTWALPGGKVEKNEGIMQAAQREIKEKVGVTVQAPNTFLRVYEANGYYMCVFVLVCPSEVETALQASPNGRWLSIAEVKQSTTLAPNVRQASLEGIACVHTHDAVQLLDFMDRIVTPAKKALERSFRFSDASSEVGGWNHFLRLMQPGIMGTAIGLRALAACHYPLYSSIVHASQEFLRRSACPGGGWSSLLITQK